MVVHHCIMESGNKADTNEPDGRIAVFLMGKMKADFKRMSFNTEHNLLEAILYMMIIRLQASDLSSEC